MCSAIMACPLSILTEQKHDVQFGTNVLGALTNLILLSFSSAPIIFGSGQELIGLIITTVSYP